MTDETKTELEELLAAEAVEQSTWATEIPAWHPRNEGEADADADDGDGEPDEDEDDETPEADEPEAEPTIDAKITAAMQEFADKIGSKIDTLAAPAPAPAAAADDDEDEDAELNARLDRLLQSLPDEHFDDRGELTPDGQLVLMAQMAREAAREELLPDRQAREQGRRDAEADALEEKYPRLQDEEFREEMIDRTIAFAQEMGQPALAAEPKLLERVYLAYEAEQRVASETPASGKPSLTLERGGAAAPAKTRKTQDPGDRIVSLAKKQHFRLGQQ